MNQVQECKPKRIQSKTFHQYDGRFDDYVVTQQTYNSTSHADSRVAIKTYDRGQATPNPSRDLHIEFDRISANGRYVSGSVTFHDGEEVKLLLDYLKDMFNEDGTRRREKSRVWSVEAIYLRLLNGDRVEFEGQPLTYSSNGNTGSFERLTDKIKGNKKLGLTGYNVSKRHFVIESVG